MVSTNKPTSARERQFIRFLDTVREIGNEPALDKLDDTLSELVPPVRAGAARPKPKDGDELQD